MTVQPVKEILVVDDERELCEVISEILEESGYKVTRAFDAPSALDLVKHHSYDAVLTDIVMPGTSGKELLQQIKAIDVNKPRVLLMTGFTKLSLEEAYDLGAEAVLNKPVPTENLLVALERLLKDAPSALPRGKERFQFDAKVEFEFDNRKIPSGVSKMVNLGRGGMFIQLEGPFPKVGEMMNFRITFYEPEFGSLRGKAVCRWVRDTPTEEVPAGVGVEFMELDSGSSSTLLSLLNNLKIKAYIPRSSK